MKIILQYTVLLLSAYPLYANSDQLFLDKETSYAQPVSLSSTVTEVFPASRPFSHETLSSLPTYNKPLSDYAAQLAMQLTANMNRLPSNAKVAVVSFVELNSSLEQSSYLGNQIAEHLIYEIQRFGITLVDFKVGKYIRLTENGDFVFSRKAEHLKRKQHIDYVLTGTVISSHRGVQLQARIVSMESNVVVATAQQFIPRFIVSSFYAGIEQ